MTTENEALPLLWGVKEIAAYIGRPQRATYHLLDQGRLPAKVVGGRWCASRDNLREFFALEPAAKDAPPARQRKAG